jgi:uncharacterized protein YebE (UPF0316 family)
MWDVSHGWGTLVITTLLIFCARICDVTLGTLRIVFISRGEKNIAPVFAFVEMLIWLFAIRQIFTNLTSLPYYFAYAAGFASGVFVGLSVEEKIAMGLRMIRTITRKDAGELVAALRTMDFGVTSVVAEGNSGPVNIVYSVIKRSDVTRYVEIVKAYNPNAFYSIEDIRFVSEGIFPARRAFNGRTDIKALRASGKSK